MLTPLTPLTLLTPLTSLALVALLAAQQAPNNNAPARTRPQFSFVTHDRLLPKDCFAVVSIAPLAEHMNEFSRTGLYKVLAPVWESIPKDTMGTALGYPWVSDKHLKAVLTQGVSFAWTGLSRAGVVSWLVIANLGSGQDDVKQALAAHMGTARLMGFRPRKEVFRGGELWTLSLPEGGTSLTLTLRDGMLLMGSNQGQVEDAVTRLLDSNDSKGDCAAATTPPSSVSRWD